MSANPSQKRLKQLLKQVPSHDDVIDMLGQLKSKDDHASDRAAAIVGATLIEHGLKVIILSAFVKLSKDDTDKLFEADGRGPLGSFGDRIRLSYAMGLIGSKSRHDLIRVQNIRNVFAHSALDVHFGRAEISEMCSQFKLIDKNDTKNAKAAYIETVAYISEALRQKISREIVSRTFMIPGAGAVTMPEPVSSSGPRRFLP